MKESNVLTRTHPEDAFRPQAFTLNAEKVDIATGRQTLRIEQTPFGAIVREGDVAKVFPEPVDTFPPFTLVSSVASSNEHATIPSFARITVDIDLVLAIQKMFVAAIEHGLEDVQVRRWGGWSDEFRSIQDRMCVSAGGQWWFEAEEKHSYVPISSSPVDIRELMAMIEASRLGYSRAFSDDEVAVSWKQQYGDTDGDDVLFSEDFGEHLPEEGYYGSLDEAGDPPMDRVWSIVEADDALFAVAGTHVVNVIGFIVTERPWRHDRQTYLWSPGVDSADEATDSDDNT